MTKPFLTLLLALLLFTPTLAFGGDSREVRLVTGEWPPYVSTGLPENGFVADMVTEAFKAVGIAARIEFVPWKRCELLLKDGKALAAFPYAKNAERAAAFDFSDTLFVLEDKFFFLKERLPDFTYRSVADLRPLLVGGAIGYHYEHRLHEAGIKVDMASDATASFKKLLAGRVDVVLEEERVGRAIVEELLGAQAGRVGVSPVPFSVNEDGLMFSRTHPDAARLRELFNQGLRAIRANVTHAAILRRHGAQF